MRAPVMLPPMRRARPTLVVVTCMPARLEQTWDPFHPPGRHWTRSSMLDDIDRGLIHALHLDARAPFSRIGAVLRVSTKTVARRYQRLRAEAGLRVGGRPNPDRAGLTQWIVRLTAQPATARPLAQSLARRPDTSWVKLTSGGTEIVAIVHTPVDEPSSMLLHDIPRTASVTAVS